MTDELRWYLIARKKIEAMILRAFRGFREQGIEPILIKGWAAARSYPPDVPRFFGDIDLAVSAADYERAKCLVDDPQSPFSGVDLHRDVRHLDTVAWKDLFANSELIPLETENVRVLSPEDHLRVLCVHWLTDGAENRGRLADILYAVQNRPVEFDWSKCVDVVSPNRRTWIVSTIGLAHKYLGLEIEDLPFAEEAKDLPRWLTQCVEKGWAGDVKLRGLDESITDRSLFLRQIGKRIPPNPIQSTIFCEGAFDHRSRLGYQIRDTFGRLLPSLRRIKRAALDQYQWSRAK